MEKLKALMVKTKCSLTLTVNNHRDYYMTVEDYLTELIGRRVSEIDHEVYTKMKELDTIIELQWYPNNPSSFYTLYHYDLDKILEKALS